MATITFDVLNPDGTRRTVTQPLDDGIANAQILQQRAQAALSANATYLALAAPTVAQNTAQTQRLTRECSALIRLLLNQLEDTSGT